MTMRIVPTSTGRSLYAGPPPTIVGRAAVSPGLSWRRMSLPGLLAIGCAALCLASPGASAQSGRDASWDPGAAAAYLDQRAAAWMRGGGAMDHGTFCVSCHTGLPYALARSALRAGLKESGPTPIERQLVSSVTKRIQIWPQVQPYLNNSGQGPATESVINALVLVCYDAPSGTLSATTREAFRIMWSLQTRTGDRAGAWPWFGDGGGGEQPWEAFDSQYWGAALAAVAVGTMPQRYRSDAEIQGNLILLWQYLRKDESRQSLLNRLTLLWAANRIPDLLTADQKASIISDVLARQRQDGGWSSPDLIAPTWKRSDGTPFETRSDGYATGMSAYVLEQSGAPRARSAIAAARSWLRHNQVKADGFWAAYSLNRQRDSGTDVGKFMSDAATAFAVLALTSGP